MRESAHKSLEKGTSDFTLEGQMENAKKVSLSLSLTSGWNSHSLTPFLSIFGWKNLTLKKFSILEEFRFPSVSEQSRHLQLD